MSCLYLILTCQVMWHSPNELSVFGSNLAGHVTLTQWAVCIWFWPGRLCDTRPMSCLYLILTCQVMWHSPNELSVLGSDLADHVTLTQWAVCIWFWPIRSCDTHPMSCLYLIPICQVMWHLANELSVFDSDLSGHVTLTRWAVCI